MMNTLKQFSRFGEMSKRSERSCCSAGAYLSDLHGDVCSRRNTRPSVRLRLGLRCTRRDGCAPGTSCLGRHAGQHRTGMWDRQSVSTAYIHGVRHSLGTPAPWLRFGQRLGQGASPGWGARLTGFSRSDATEGLTAKLPPQSHTARAAVCRLLVFTVG
jgi:hypothetical protein